VKKILISFIKKKYLTKIILSSEAIFFAISLLQFFKIKFMKFGGIINISD